MIGPALSTGGSGAHGDLTGVGGPGGLATNVGFSEAPLRINPLPELDDIPPSFTVDDADGGAGDFGLETSVAVGKLAVTGSGFGGIGAASSACGSEIFVPSVHSIDSGAQSSSSSSISAQFACLPGSSDCSLVAKCMPYCCLSSSSVIRFCSGGGAAA